MGSHTPGPWHIRPDWVGDENILVDCGDRNVPYTLGNVASVTNHRRLMSSVDQQVRKQQQAEANALLIMTAPELLESLQAALAAMDMQEQRESEEFHINQATAYLIWTEAKDKAVAAIARATGANQ